MPRKDEITYEDEEHEQKRTYMREYRNRMKNSFVHFKKKTGLRSRDLVGITQLDHKVAYVKLYDHFGNHKDTREFLEMAVQWSKVQC
ncbi:MAG: hypothetical protein [Cressdnaviricota sp.]|nr:MAG: hypothetical protein [Cressdnaviricota sp.]